MILNYFLKANKILEFIVLLVYVVAFRCSAVVRNAIYADCLWGK